MSDLEPAKLYCSYRYGISVISPPKKKKFYDNVYTTICLYLTETMEEHGKNIVCELIPMAMWVYRNVWTQTF